MFSLRNGWKGQPCVDCRVHRFPNIGMRIDRQYLLGPRTPVAYGMKQMLRTTCKAYEAGGVAGIARDVGDDVVFTNKK